MPRVSEEHKEAVRRRILDAALVCLERNGFQDLTTRELLAEAGLSTGTFYNYFPSKEHLYAALASEALAADVDRALAEGGRDPGDPGVGPGLLRFVEEFLLANPTSASAVASFRSRMSDRPQAAEAIGELNGFVVSTFAPLVAESVRDGFLRPGLDAEALVELIDIMWDGMGRRLASEAFQTSYDRVSQVLVALLVEGVVAADRTGNT